MAKIKAPNHKKITEIETTDKNLVGILESKAEKFEPTLSQEKIFEKAFKDLIENESLDDIAKEKVNPDIDIEIW